MSIQVTCGDCAAEYRLANRYAGKRCKCRECGTRIPVPAEVSAKAEKKAKKAKRRKARATVAAAPNGVSSRGATRRLGAQDSDIISERRELRRRMGVPRPVSESLHQLAPMYSGDELERLVPKRRRRKGKKTAPVQPSKKKAETMLAVKGS